MSARRRRIGLGLAVVLAVSLTGARSRGEEQETLGALHEDFEGPQPAWKREVTDATVRLIAHERSNRGAHDGKTSERFHFVTGVGSALYVSYPVPNVPVVKDLKAQLFVRSNQTGIQIFGRVILPADVNPETGQPSFVLVSGTRNDTADRWQRLELADLPLGIERQARVLRAATQRPIPLEGAYLDQVVVNVYGGPGESEVLLDDLTVQPVPASALANRVDPAQAPGAGGEPGAGLGPAPAQARIQLQRNRLTKDGAPWIPRIIMGPGCVEDDLIGTGCDVLYVPPGVSREAIRGAVRPGLFFMPGLQTKTDLGNPRDPSAIVAQASSFPVPEAVAWWDLGEHLGGEESREAREEQRDLVRESLHKLRQLPRGTPLLTTAGLEGMYPDYASIGDGIDLIGIHPDVWGACLDPLDYYQFLKQRRDLTALANPAALFWTWIPVASPEEVRVALWGRQEPPPWGVARVQPEQVRLFTYAALSAGYRGVGFRADAELSQLSGKARLIELGLLNAEIDLFETFLAEAEDPIPLMYTYPPDPPIPQIYNATAARLPKPHPETPPHPTIKAASFATLDRRSQLLMVTDFAAMGQWQPPQMALNDLRIVVPAPESSQFWEVSLGGLRLLEDRQRIPGGIKITIPDFGPTALILATTDLTLAQRLEAAVARVRPRAIQLAIEQAELQLQDVTDIHYRLIQYDNRRDVRNSDDLLKECRQTIQDAHAALAREDYPVAWAEARRSSRFLRLLMRVHFASAFGELYRMLTPPAPAGTMAPGLKLPLIPSDPDTALPVLAGYPYAPLLSPVSSPGLLAYNTLEAHYYWMDRIREGYFSPNLLPSGYFEQPDQLEAEGWIRGGYPVEGLESMVKRVKGTWEDKKYQGRGNWHLMLSVRPDPEARPGTISPYQDDPVVTLTTPPVPVRAGDLMKISLRVRMPSSIPPGGGGLIVRDSIGGRALQFRTTVAVPAWQELILFRRAPDDGEMTVTFGLAATQGKVFVDDFRIERLILGSAPPRPRGPDLATPSGPLPTTSPPEVNPLPVELPPARPPAAARQPRRRPL